MSSSSARAYLVAVIVTVVAVTASLPLQRTFDRFPYLPLLVAAVIVSAWIGGLGPGLLAAGGGAVAAEYLVMGGLHAVGTHPELLAQLALFVAVAAIATSIRGSRTRAAAIRRDRLLWELEERVKELTLLHRATSLLQEDKDLGTLLRQLVALLPPGWQFPEMLEARITVSDLVVATPGFRTTPWIQRAEFPRHNAPSGLLEVVYREAVSAEADESFLPEERRLLDSLASLLASYFERVHRVEERLELARAQASQIEAQAANRMKDAFLATVSHELRRPLTAMLGWTRMLREGHAADSARGLEVIERNAKIQLRLIEELLDLSRTATGQLGVAFSLVDLSAIVRHAADAARPAAADRQVEIITRSGGDDTPVLGDGMRLQQIVGNLVANAIKFTPEGGLVTITLERSGREVRLVVADTGIGIDPAVLPHLFERFWQADPSAPPAREGLGIGLSIVRRLVELHGGTIHAESVGPGSGTRMTVSLPLAADVVSRDAPASSLGALYLEFDIARELQQLRLEPGWHSGHNARTLVKYDGLRIVLIALKARSRIPEHHTDGQISIQTIVGHIQVRSNGRSFELRPGGLLAVDQGVPHDVEALEESAFLLTIAWPGEKDGSVR